MSTGIRGLDSQGIATSTQPALTHTENIHTPATTSCRVVESREPLNQSQLIATLTPSELGSSATSLSKQTVSLTHTQQLYTLIDIRTGYDQSSTTISSTPSAPKTSVQQLSTPSTSPTGWNSNLPISSLVIAAVVVVVFVGTGILVIVTVIIAICCR